MTGPIKTLAFVACFAALAACDSAEERAEAKYQSALELLEAGDEDRAIVELRNVFKFDGAHKEGRRTLADILIDQGKLREGYSQYLRLVEQYPTDLEGRITLARLAFEIRNWDELERHAAEAQNLAAGDDRVRIVEVAVRYRAGFRDDDANTLSGAAEDAEAFLVKYPDDEILRKVLIDHEIRQNNYETALGHIDHLISLRPDDKSLYQQRLGAIARNNDPEAIEAELLNMVSVFPDDLTIKSNVIQFYVSRSELDKAEGFLRDQSSPTDEDLGLYTDLIRFLAEVKGTEAALTELDRGIAENPNPTPLRALRSGLRFLEGQQLEAIKELEDVIAGEEPGETTNIRSARSVWSKKCLPKKIPTRQL